MRGYLLGINPDAADFKSRHRANQEAIFEKAINGNMGKSKIFCYFCIKIQLHERFLRTQPQQSID